MEFLDNTFWATVALLVFLGAMIYYKVPGLIIGMLDTRIAKIESDLDEAKQLREDAQALLAEYERKRKAAEGEAEDIISAAQEEAEHMAQDAKVALEELIMRRTKAVEEKIAQAEAQAVTEVRARSAEVAVEAARIILIEQMADKGDMLVDDAISDVAKQIN